jgi:hypothetical protein
MPATTPGEEFSPEYVAGMATIWVSRRLMGDMEARSDAFADLDADTSLAKIEGSGGL